MIRKQWSNPVNHWLEIPEGFCSDRPIHSCKHTHLCKHMHAYKHTAFNSFSPCSDTQTQRNKQTWFVECDVWNLAQIFYQNHSSTQLSFIKLPTMHLPNEWEGPTDRFRIKLTSIRQTEFNPLTKMSIHERKTVQGANSWKCADVWTPGLIVTGVDLRLWLDFDITKLKTSHIKDAGLVWLRLLERHGKQLLTTTLARPQASDWNMLNEAWS